MSAAEVLRSVQYVIDSHGQLSAVQMSIDAWHALLDWVEDIEDRAVVKAMLPRLRQGPERTGALRWDAIRDEWDAPQAK